MTLLPNLEQLVVETTERFDRHAGAQVGGVASGDAGPAPSPAAATTAPHKPPRRPRRRWPLAIGAAGGLAVAGSAAVLLIGAGSHGELDVISEARAALAPQGGILHIDITTRGRSTDAAGHVIRTGGQASLAQHIEQWSVSNPSRYRMLVHESRQTVEAQKQGAFHGPSQAHTHLQPRFEVAWAAGAQSSYDGDRHSMLTVTGLSPRSSAATPMAIFGAGRSLDDLRGLLASHALRDRGTAVVDGRSVRRLIGRIHGSNWPGTVEYDIDRQTFAPVRVVSRLLVPAKVVGPDGPGHGVMTSISNFNRFERLPLNAQNEGLLVIHPPAGVKSVTRTLREQRVWGRAQEAKMNAIGKANLERDIRRRTRRR